MPYLKRIVRCEKDDNLANLSFGVPTYTMLAISTQNCLLHPFSLPFIFPKLKWRKKSIEISLHTHQNIQN